MPCGRGSLLFLADRLELVRVNVLVALRVHDKVPRNAGDHDEGVVALDKRTDIVDEVLGDIVAFLVDPCITRKSTYWWKL